ncbi:MAG: tetratricopeptide repeat protein [Candidatus Brocadiaceae bacterium]|nr:tetratricopeptide repeat protein [Candidatus Brocadiaceae bacterium]
MIKDRLNDGETLYAEGKIEDAEKCFLSIVENYPDCKEAYNNLGVIAFQNDDKERAIDYFTRSLEIDPIYRDTIVNYTNLLRSIDQLPIVIPLLEKVVDITPDDKEMKQLLDDIRHHPTNI